MNPLYKYMFEPVHSLNLNDYIHDKPVSVLLSGGLDSVIAYYMSEHLGNDTTAISVDVGQPYLHKERASLASLNIPHTEVSANLISLLPPREDGDWIIPGRNLLLVLLASMKSPVVWLSALSTEMHPYARERDKSVAFYQKATELLTYVMNCEHESVKVMSPFEKLSKSQMVYLALEILDIPKETLLATSSCYDGEDKSCGMCGTCFKRWIALANNGLSESYSNDPWLSPYAQKSTLGIIEAIKSRDYSHYTFDRCVETINALWEYTPYWNNLAFKDSSIDIVREMLIDQLS